MPEKIWIFTERAGAPACTKYMHRNIGIQKSFQHLHAVIGGQIDRKIPELVEKFCKFIPGKLHVIVVQCQRQRMFCRQGWIFFHDEPETVGEETFFPVKFRKKLQHKRKIIKVSKARAIELAMNLNGVSRELAEKYTDSELREVLRLLKLKANF